MRAFLKAVRRLIFVLIGLGVVAAVTLGTLVFWVTAHPDDAYRLARRYVLPADLELGWRSVHFRPRRISWLHWAVEWRVEGLKIKKGTPRVDVPLEEFALEFEASVWRPRTHADFARVIVRAPERILIETSGGDGGGGEVKNPFEMIKDYVDRFASAARYATVRALEIEFAKVMLLRPGQKNLTLSARLTKAAEDPEIHLNLAAAGAGMIVAADGRARPDAIDTPGPFLAAHVTFEGSGVKEAGDLAFVFTSGTLGGTFKGDVSYAGGARKIVLKPDVVLTIDARRAHVKLTTPVTGLPDPIRAVDPVVGELEVPLATGRLFSASASILKVEAPLDFKFLSREMRTDFELPERVRVRLGGKLWLDALSDARSARREAADLRLEADRVENKLFTLAFAAGLKLARDRGAFVFEPQLDSDVHLASFRRLRNLLDQKNVLIPAPFDKLEGTVDVTAHGPVTRDPDKSETPIDVRVALASEHQAVRLNSTVTLALKNKPSSLDVFVKLLIEDFTIQLPPLEPLAGVPPVARDQRVLLEPPKPAPPPKPARKADAFQMNVYVSAVTVRPGAIRLLSPLAKPHVPITVNVDRTGSGDLTGTVQLEPFDITYLRRTVRVEHLRVSMDERDAAAFPVDGRFRIDQTQYKIFVDVSGNVRAPSIRLSSEPYLPRQEIISVLLYDRTNDQLVGGDAETAGQFDAAMTDRAIGLFGLWAFASTPIKSFSYNPVTKVYSATVQLADGLTAGIGTNWEEAASFEVRKRVSRRWVLTASWSPSETTRDQVGKLTLQWEKRF